MPPARAIIFIGLNAVRILSIITLLLVFASQIVVMVTNIEAVNAFEAQGGNSSNLRDCDYIDGSTVPNQPAGVFWAVVATLLIIIQSVILLLSEIGWPMKFFDRYFPVLGSEFGLGPLGIFQGLIATQILSHHVDDFTLVSAFFLFAIGCLNMLLGLVFRESAKERRLILAWRAKSKEILPQTTDSDGPELKRFVLVGKNGSPAPFVSRSLSTMKSEKEMGYGWGSTGDFKSDRSTEKAGHGFGRQGEKAAAWKGYLIQKPEESLPRYMSPPPKSGKVSRTPSSRSSTSSNEDQDDEPEPERSPSRTRSPAYRSQSRSESRSEQPEKPVPKFKSSPTAI